MLILITDGDKNMDSEVFNIDEADLTKEKKVDKISGLVVDYVSKDEAVLTYSTSESYKTAKMDCDPEDLPCCCAFFYYLCVSAKKEKKRKVKKMNNFQKIRPKLMSVQYLKEGVYDNHGKKENGEDAVDSIPPHHRLIIRESQHEPNRMKTKEVLLEKMSPATQRVVEKAKQPDEGDFFGNVDDDW